MVGMLAERPPEGFGFSDTAFRVFILMASRRLQSDRFFTDDYRPEVYTTLGIAWVENTTMTDVILRHFPQLGTRLRAGRERVQAVGRPGQRPEVPRVTPDDDLHRRRPSGDWAIWTTR